MAAFLFVQNEARAAVGYGAAGAVATGTTALSVPHPAGIAAGHLLVLVVGNKFSPANPPATPAGWTLVGQGAGGLGNTSTNDEGPVFSTIFVKEAVGGESGNLAVTLAGANSSMGRMFRYTKAAGTSWNYAATSGSDNTAGTAWSVTGAANPGITTGDMLIVGSTTNTDQYTYSAESVAATGATLGTHTERQDSGTGNGRDMRLVASDHRVTGGTATAAPLFTMTASGSGTNRPTGASVILRIREVPAPTATTTLATGTDPAAATIAPGAAATDVNQFTLQTSSGTEAITSVTVSLSTNSGVGLLAITDNSNNVLGSTASPVAGSNTITVTGMSATTTLTTFKVRVTPLSHAAMPLPNGAAYAITTPVTAWAGPNTHAGSDTNPNALTIDNLSPSGATGTGGSAGSDSVTLNWTTSVSADFSITDGSVLYRWTTTAGAEVPAEGSAPPTVNSVNGAATVACVISSAASAPLTAIDGTGGSAGCNTTALAAGTAYVYKIFQKDANGNYNTGVTIGTFTTTYPVPTTTSIAPTSKTLGAATFTLTVNGTNFTPGSVVRFNGSNRTTTYVSPTQLTATIPATDLTVVGTFPITVFNPAPGGGTSNAQTFTVDPAPPTAVTNAASALTASGATLNGTVSSNGAITTVTFNYGTTIAYGSSATAAQSPLAAVASGAAVSAAVTGLACNTLYHFRVKGVNSAGTTNGGDLTFTTSACPPQVTVTPATGGGAINSNTAPGCDAAGWTALTGPAIAETVAAQIGLGTIVLSAPAGFEFNTAAPVRILLAGNATASRNINNLPTGTLIVPSVTSTTITFTVTAVGTRVNTLTWQDIQVRPTLSTPLAAGNITHTGTSTIAGVTGATNLGTLTEVTSVPACKLSAPTTTKSFVPASIAANGTSTLTITITNPNTAAISGLAFTDTYPSTNLKNATTPALTNTCGGTATGTAGASALSLSGGTLPASSSCSVSVSVTSATAGSYLNSTGAVTSTNAASGTAALASLTVTAVSAANSTVVANPTSVVADNSATSLITVTLRDGAGNGVSGKTVTLAAGSGSSTISAASGPSSASGVVTFTVKDGTVEGPITYTATTTDAIVVTQTAQVTFVATEACVPVPTTVNDNGTAVAAPVVASTNNLSVGNNSYITSSSGSLYTSGNGTSMTTTSGVGPPGQTLPAFSPATFPSVGGANKNINNGTLAAGSYGVVGISGSSTFSGGNYYISELKAGNGVTLTMAAGDYFVDKWDVGNNFTLSVSSGPVRIFINTQFKAGNQSTFNASGSTANLQIYVYDNADIEFGNANNGDSDIDFNGLIYAPGSNTHIEFGNNNVIQGAILSGGDVQLGNNTGVIFDSATQAAIASISLSGGSCMGSAAKSFAPGTITEGAASLLTITLTNVTASSITGVSFTDTYPSGMVNTASANGATTCGGTVTAANGGSSLALSGGTIPASGSCTVTVNVTSAVANSYINSVSFTPGSIGSASATLMVNAAVFGAFNACDDAPDPNFSCTSATTPTTSRITTKIAGVPFTLDLVALKTDGTWNSSYSNDVIVELLDSSDNSGAFDANNCRSSWTPVIETLGSNPSFGSSNGQITTLTSFTVPEAYRDVRVRVTNNGGATRVGCSTDNFAIRPNSLEVIPTDTDWQTTGAARTINNTDATSPGSQASTPNPIHKAGQLFTVTATAKNASNVTTANYNVTVAPAAILSACSPGTACTASFGIFNLGAGSATSGVVTWSSASYNEVGAFDLTLQDTDFTSVDAADTAASCAGRYVCGTASVGRFVPDHFGLAGSVVTRSDLQTTEGQAMPFTYMDEPMKLSLVVTAYNANDVKTNNYAGNFAKLHASTMGTGTNWFNTGCTGSTQCMGLGTVNGATGLSSRLLVVGAGTYASVGDPSSSWIAGVGTFTVHAKLARKATVTDWPTPPNSLLDGPYDTLKFGGMPKDSEGVTLPGPASSDTHKVDLNATTGDTLASNPDGIDERKEIFQTAARFGRLWLGNACGSDKRDLTILFRTEYWNGNVFITNGDDGSTSIAKANIGLGNHQPAGFDGSVDLTHIPAGPFSAASGLGSFSLVKPTGSPAAGSVDIVFALESTTATNTSFDFSTVQPPTVGANMPYLRGKWYGTTYDHAPVARAAFGIYCGGGSGRGPIYIRESY